MTPSTLKDWIGGLISAASGGLSGALGANFADPKNFGIDNPKKLAIVAVFSAIVPVLAYLKRRPLPGVTGVEG